ncbi:MAG: hypothetical protein OEU26_34250 [Candidatus Tectomicrobia bacterium]|nr:hypothetical protein [Candidatus Tectomicrobia bacterium]
MHVKRCHWPMLLSLGIALGLMGCVKPPIDYRAASPPACRKPAHAATYGDFPLHHFLPLPMSVLEDKFRREPFNILEAKATAQGSTSAVRFRIQFRDCTVLEVKWRASPPGARRYNNDPRREIAAYVFQKLFLEPEDYVVPVTVPVCIPAADMARIGLRAEPQIAGSDCVFGPMAIWLQNVQSVGNFLDRDRFEQSVTGQEASDYARQFANLNIFTYLISHRDGRKGNFLVSTVPEQPHIFSIDNSLAYEGMGNPRPFIPRWARLKVDKLPRATIERLRRITTEQLSRQLGVVSEGRLTEDGHLKRPLTFSPNINPQQGYRQHGDIVQLGLSNSEISKIAARLRKLLERVDSGNIQLF